MKTKEEQIAKELAKADMKKDAPAKKKVTSKVKAKVKEATESKLKKDFQKEKAAKDDKVSALYRDEVYADLHPKQRKSFRMKARRTRNTFAKNIISLAKKKDQKELQAEVKNFMIFYKENYKVNDLTVTSLSAKNNDDDTEVLLNEALSIIKKMKVAK